MRLKQIQVSGLTSTAVKLKYRYFDTWSRWLVSFSKIIVTWDAGWTRAPSVVKYLFSWAWCLSAFRSDKITVESRNVFARDRNLAPAHGMTLKCVPDHKYMVLNIGSVVISGNKSACSLFTKIKKKIARPELHQYFWVTSRFRCLHDIDLLFFSWFKTTYLPCNQHVILSPSFYRDWSRIVRSSHILIAPLWHRDTAVKQPFDGLWVISGRNSFPSSRGLTSKTICVYSEWEILPNGGETWY